MNAGSGFSMYSHYQLLESRRKPIGVVYDEYITSSFGQLQNARIGPKIVTTHDENIRAKVAVRGN